MPSVSKTVLCALFVTAGVVQGWPVDRPKNGSAWSQFEPAPPEWVEAARNPNKTRTHNGFVPWSGEYHPKMPIPESAPAAAIIVQPVLDFDKDSCYNVHAIDVTGQVAEGMDPFTKPAEGCREPYHLDYQNVYVRSRCNNGWCARMYEYYFMKDVATWWLPWWHHRHEWENIVVVTMQGEDSVRFVCVSQHRGYQCKNVDSVRFEGTHPKVVYHKDGMLTHSFRFAYKEDEPVENHKGTWIRGALVDWNMFPMRGMRFKMTWYYRAVGVIHTKMNNKKFAEHLQKAIEGRCPGFDFNKDG